MDKHQCEHCQQVLLDLCDTSSGDLPADHNIRIDCRINASTSILIETFSRVGRGKCAFLDFLMDTSESGEVRIRSSYAGARLRFKSANNVLFALTAKPGDPAARYIKARPLNIQTSSEYTFKVARKWLKDCLDSHKNCMRHESLAGFKPTRLVEILRTDPSWRVRVCRPIIEVDYVALSYCWGGPQTMLTTKTEQAWNSSLPWDELAQTIKDSIYVSARLGFKYLWIDALCIVQDDLTDKMGEIAAMTHVYGAATLTIAASSALTAKEGFLQDKRFTEFPEQVFELPIRCPDGQVGTVTMFRPPPNTHLSAEPLDGRGWTLQERHLSNRFLDFKKLQLRWSCNTMLLNQEQGYVDGWDNQDIADAVAQVDPVHDAMVTWMRLIYGYTLRNLTVTTDRILAISGIADVLGRSIEGEYWAGLWESNLSLCLMWQSSPSETEFTSLPPRPTEYQGPSWSWVSVNAIVHYECIAYDNFETCVEALGCNIELVAEKAKYGAVKKADLHLRGRIRRAMLQYCPGPINVYERRWKLDAGLTEGQAYARGDALEPEFASHSSSGIPVILLEVVRRVSLLNSSEGVGDAISEGLILRQLPTQQYFRLGTFAFYTDLKPGHKVPYGIWFQDCDKQALCLV